MAGVTMAPFVGRLVDKMVPWYGTLAATLLMLFTAAVRAAEIYQEVFMS